MKKQADVIEFVLAHLICTDFYHKERDRAVKYKARKLRCVRNNSRSFDEKATAL